MSTIGNQLNILRDTQMVQRRLLEKQFPYIDWERMPFSSYGDFFRLRGILDDCGAVWTNAYGRSNTEADGQRNFLEDYSGNGRDIELFNFGYSKQSGFNGYVQDFRKTDSNYISGSISESRVDVTNISESASNQWIVWIAKTNYVNKAWEAYVEYDRSNVSLVFYNSDYETIKSVGLQSGAINKIPALTDDEWSQISNMVFSVPKGVHLTLTQVPLYPGALVGDGVDDYGQGVKDFALPDDYTVVAMREILTPNSCLASKILDAQNGAFCMELFGNSTISYGTVNNGVPPKLFSFQTRVSYNGSSINSGTSGDGNTNKLMLFKRPLDTPCSSVALYSFGIFTRTLTEDELRTVENCMYAEWIAMTGKLEDIEYYDILDARFRSNDEAENKRNRWVGRLGKLHMTLHNYAYSGNSGWNGETGEDGKPLYGGALVSDGVDDYADSDEIMQDMISGIVMLAEKVSEPANTYGNIFSSYVGLGSTSGKEIAGLISRDNENIIIGDPWTSFNKSDDAAYGFARSPRTPGNKLVIGNNKNNEWGNAALYQLRLIKNKPTDVQLEAIKWQCRKEHDDYLVHMGWKDDSPAWYGVEWDVTDSSPDVRRIGNMQMHRDLPVQSQMRGCLLDDNGVVLKYLNADDWTSETLDGSAGQVMVQAPVDFYWRFEKDGNIRRVKFATTRLPGFKRTPQGFISAHEATVQRSTNKLCSVVNTDPDYRGGSNKAEWDGTYRSLLGMPATSISRTSFRTYARNRKQDSTEWNCMTYDFQKLLYWLFVVEYATLNTQKPVNTEKDANGFSQGGLGNGVTTWDWTAWSNHNGNHPLIPCGVTNKLGNNSGEVAFQITLSDNTNKEFKVARYRGVENPFGHVWQWTDGLNLRISANTSAGGDGLSRIFTCSDPAKFSDTGYDGYKYIGDAPRAEGYMKDIVFGEDGDIMPISTGGSTTTYFCDYWYTSIPDSGESLRGVLFGGSANHGANAGFGYAYSHNAPSYTSANFGSRLCFIPA